MHLSYWERSAFLGEPHTVVVGGGITGLSAALHTRRLHPDREVLLLERGHFPAGASTRNAGFACFGSAGEMAADLRSLPPEKITDLVQLRWNGLKLLRETCGDKHLNYEPCGSLELFQSEAEFAVIQDRLPELNALTQAAIGQSVFEEVRSPLPHSLSFPFAIRNRLEGALDTGRMMARLTQLTQEAGVRIVTGMEVQHISSHQVKLAQHTLRPQNILVATNAFARELLPDLEVTPVRNQVWISHPIPNLPIRGTFHMDEGYVYFRNVGDRLLIGGFRNEFPKSETTADFGIHPPLEKQIKTFTAEHLLPEIDHSWDLGWSGILGVGSTKTPIVKRVQPGVFTAVRLGGMGVAIGSELGRQLANLPS